MIATDEEIREKLTMNAHVTWADGFECFRGSCFNMRL